MPRPRRIGIHGTCNAGKTCYLGCLYGFRITPEARVTFTDDVTLSHLRALWTPLQERRSPGATPMTLPAALHLAIEPAEAGPAVLLELCDYAGALVQPLPQAGPSLARELSQDVRAWIASCQVVLLFLDSAQPDHEQLDAFDLLLTELRKPSSGPGRLERPLGLVLTKWDQQGPVSGDLAHEQQRAREFLESHSVFRQLFLRLRDLEGDQVQIFPVSAFGNHAQGEQPPAHIEPCHLHAPLLWAAQVADRVLLEQAREEVRPHLERAWAPLGFPLLPWPDHQAARAVYLRLRDDHGGAQSRLAGDIDRELAALRDSHWGHRLWLGVPILAMLLILGAGLFRFGQIQAEQAVRGLRAFRDDNGQWEQALERYERAQRFLDSWWTWVAPAARERVRLWAEEDEAAARAKADYDATQQEGQEQERQGNWPEAVARYTRFLETWTEIPYRVKASVSDQIAHLSPLVEDSTDYQAFRFLALGSSARELEEAAQKAKLYLQKPGGLKAMQKEVRAWLRWFDRFQQDGMYTITVRSVSIPRDSALLPLFGQPRVKVFVSLDDGPSVGTKQVIGPDLAFDYDLGRFPFRWGKPGKLQVRVESTGLLPGRETAVGEVTDPKFILGRAHGAFVTTCRKGRKVLVQLDCEAVVPPPLPPYQRPHRASV
jgi:hypothetical protein